MFKASSIFVSVLLSFLVAAGPSIAFDPTNIGDKALKAYVAGKIGKKVVKTPIYCARNPGKCTAGVLGGIAVGAIILHKLDEANKDRKCPDPSAKTESMSDAARGYQRFVTGLPDNSVIYLGGVAFDGCRESDGTLLEAKGPSYGKFVSLYEDRGKTWADGPMISNINQAQIQRRMAQLHGRRLEWHFAEKEAADAFRKRLATSGIDGIVVIHTPYPGK